LMFNSLARCRMRDISVYPLCF